METTDPLTGATPAWEQFIASLNPATVELERFGRPSAGERPGSAGWRRMLAEHSVQHARFYAVRRGTLPVLVAESAAWGHRHEKALTNTHLRIAMVAANNTKEQAA